LASLRDTRLTEHDLAALGTRAADELRREDPLWPGQVTTFAALLLYLALPPQFTVGPNWPLPLAEALALLTLIFGMRTGRKAAARRQIAIAVILIAVFANLTALGLLVHYLLSGGQARAANLIGGGVAIWTTNLALFAVLYWEIDRGGPLRPGTDRAAIAPDFLFPQMTVDDRWFRGWTPGFVDYLYVSLTNQTAFSPTDTLPVTLRMKILMGTQGLAALITTGVVVARAVNILGG
jgi:uncharacterized membrane protein